MGFTFIVIYLISVIILLSLLYTNKRHFLSYWISFFPFFNTIILLLYAIHCLLKHFQRTFTDIKLKKEWITQEQKMKAQGVYLIKIDGKKYTVYEKELFQ